MIDKVTAQKIAETYYNDVLAFCLSKLENKYEAEEITQDTFLAFQVKADELTNDHILAWLINTANNLVKHYFREQKRFVQEEIKEAHISVEDILECLERECPITPEQIESQKQQVLSCLNEKEAEFFKKRYLEHKSYREIGNEMNVSENAANIYCYRLRKKIIEESKLVTTAWVLLVAKLLLGNF